MINKLEKILVDKKTENIDVFLQFGSKINEIIDSVNSLESAKETIAELMDRVYKLELMASSCYVKYPTNAEVNRALEGIINSMKSFDNKSLNLKNLDTKKEHALRLQLRDTKDQFKHLEEAHRKLVKAHKTLQKSYSELQKTHTTIKTRLINLNCIPLSPNAKNEVVCLINYMSRG